MFPLLKEPNSVISLGTGEPGPKLRSFYGRLPQYSEERDVRTNPRSDYGENVTNRLDSLRKFSLKFAVSVLTLKPPNLDWTMREVYLS